MKGNNSIGLKIENQSGKEILISSNGFIGVKTMDPKHDLDVMSTAHIQDVFGQTASFESTATAPLMIRTSSEEQGLAFIVTESGNVGVQTTNSMYTLEVNGPININGQIWQNGTPVRQSEGRYILESDKKSYVNSSSEIDVPNLKFNFLADGSSPEAQLSVGSTTNFL